MSTNPFTKRSIRKDSDIFKKLLDEGWIEESYEKTSMDKNEFKNSTVSLKEHQDRVVNHFKTKRGLIAIHGLGSGKTITSIASTIEYLNNDINKEDNNKSRKVFVFTPSSLEDNFRKEMIKYIDNQALLNKFIIMSYDKFSRNYDDYKNIENYFLIIDEAHNLRTKIGKTTGIKAKRILEFSKKADKVLLLTATPFYNEPYDVTNLVAMANKMKGIPSKDFFNSMILSDKSKLYFENYFKDIISFYTPDNKTLKNDYPSNTLNHVYLKMNGKYLEIYNLLEKNSKITEMYYKNPNLFYNGLRQASNKIDDSMLSPKIEWVRKFLELHIGEKTLIFSNWIQAGVKYIKQVVPLDSFLIIDGNTNKSDRQKIVKEYNENKDKNILIISKAGGEGLDLKNTKNVIILDPSWNKSVDDQVMGRAIRYKSHEDLPLEDRHVNTYQLFLLKPSEHNYITNNLGPRYSKLAYRNTQTEKWSVDLYLKILSKEKNDYLKKFTKDFIIPNSIEMK